MKAMASLLVASAVVAFGFVSPASATIVDVVYSGTVYQSNDQIGVFGPAGGSLVGDSYTARYVFNTAKGATAGGGSAGGYAFGGSFFGNASPLVSAIVTINGHSVRVNGLYASMTYGSNSGISNEQYQLAVDLSPNSKGYTDDFSKDTIYNNNGALSASLTGPFYYTLSASDIGNGSVGFFTYDNASGTYVSYSYEQVTLTDLTVSSVPEISTWAMILLGFCSLGLAGSSRAKKQRLAQIA